MKEGKSKVVKREYTGKPYVGAHGTLYGFNIEFEDGQTGLYNSKSEDPKHFKVGEVCDYIAEEKTNGAGKQYWIIKPKVENNFGGGGFKGKPSNVFALECARKMYNSSHQSGKPIEKTWTLEEMFAAATMLLGKLNSGVSQAAIDCACTNACAKMMQGQALEKGELNTQIKLANEWLNTNK